MSSNIQLPVEFLDFVRNCKLLMEEIKHQIKTREDFAQYEVTFKNFERRKLNRALFFSGVIGRWTSKIKGKRHVPKKVVHVSHQWHLMTCSMTLNQLRGKLGQNSATRLFLSTYHDTVKFS